MKLLHTADWHLGKRLNEYTRIEEQRVVLNEVCEIAEKEAVDAVLIAGDLFDTANPGSDATELFYKTVHRLANHGRRAVIAIAGNHDAPDRIDAPIPLANVCGVVLMGRPDKQINPFQLDSGLQVLQSAPGFAELRLPKIAYPLRLLLTPYANEVTLKKYLGKEDKEDELRKLLQQSWQSLADTYCDSEGVNILMAHLYFMQKDGILPEEPDDEKPILHMGGAQAIYAENIPGQIQYVALGHLHRHQLVSATPCPLVYSSSPLAYSFSEAHQQKFVVIIEAEPGSPVHTSPIPLQQGRKLLRERFMAVDEAIQWLKQHPETYVELTLVSDTYIESKDKKALYEAHDGIVSIIPEITGEQHKEDAPQSKTDLNKNIRDTFRDYFYQKKGQYPNEELMALFNEILNTDTQDT